jgi:hypothetical protein
MSMSMKKIMIPAGSVNRIRMKERFSWLGSSHAGAWEDDYGG